MIARASTQKIKKKKVCWLQSERNIYTHSAEMRVGKDNRPSGCWWWWALCRALLPQPPPFPHHQSQLKRGRDLDGRATKGAFQLAAKEILSFLLCVSTYLCIFPGYCQDRPSIALSAPKRMYNITAKSKKKEEEEEVFLWLDAYQTNADERCKLSRL